MSFRVVCVGSYTDLIRVLTEAQDGEALLIVNTRVTTPEDAMTGIWQAKLLISDFCDTLTLKGQYLVMGEYLMKSYLCAQDVADAERVFRQCHVTPLDVMSLIHRSIGRMIDSRVGWDQFEHVAQYAGIRPGVPELIESFLEASDVPEPVVVVTSGNRDFVQAWQRHFFRQPLIRQIHGLQLKWRKSGARQLIGYEDETLVCAENKTIKVALECRRSGLEPHQVVTTGDSPLIDDGLLRAGQMLDFKGEVVRRGVHGILVVPDRKTAMDHPHGQHHMRRALDSGLPMILVSPSLDPIAKIRRGEFTL